jgi:hypothetical protein
MLEVALEHGGRDNVTALLLSLDDPGFPLPLGGEAIRMIPPPPTDVDQPAKIGLLSKWRRFLKGKP